MLSVYETWLHAVDKYGILTKREVKMARYWPRSFFFCVFMGRDGVELHLLAIKRTRPIFSHLNRKSLADKDYMAFGEFFLAVHSLERARLRHRLPPQVASLSAVFV